MESWIYALDIFGTAVFALTGALKAARHKLDILGVLVLGSVTGVGGGMLRDGLLGYLPPAALRDERYILICLASSLLIFFTAPMVNRLKRGLTVLLIADAVGLGVFTAIGVAKGAAAGLGTVGILLTGALSAVGGGMLRDIMVREVPAVISRDFYATASLLGGAAFLIIRSAGFSLILCMTAAFLVTTGLRLTAMTLGISLPKAIPPEGDTT